MGKLQLPFHSYTHRSPQVASRRLVNCYAEQAPMQAKGPLCLMRSPGVESWLTLPTGPVRGACTHAGSLYVVSGGRLYRVSSGGAYTDLGAIPGTNRVSMASNGTQLVIVTNPAGYVYDGELAQITDDAFTSRGASSVAVVDSYALFTEPNTGRWFHSDLLDAEAYDDLDFWTAEAYPDNLVSILVDHRQVFLLGSESIELWYNAGATSGSPFAREQNGVIEVGCGAAFSPAKADNTVFWFTNQRTAVRLSDLTPVRISTHALEQKWQDYARVDDAYSFVFMHEGHQCYGLTFPSAGDTFIFDIAAGEWHERRSRVSTGGDAQWRAATCTAAYGTTIVGDARSGKLGKLKSDCYTEFDEILRMEFTFPSIYAEDRRAFHHRLQIDVQSGKGLTTGQGSDPQLMLSISDDGGLTFDAVPNRSTGAIGQYRYRSTWNRLGVSSDRVYRAAVSDPVPVTVWNATLEVEGGRL